MLCEYNYQYDLLIVSEVLILVLMEYALRGDDVADRFFRTFVLILVLMEYALRVYTYPLYLSETSS